MGECLPKLLAALLIGVCLTAPVRADNRVALVIGNSSYRNVSRLDNPVNDARLMADTLRGLGFKLAGGAAQLDLDKARFDEVLQQFSNLMVGADVALFYYAGHGVQVRGANYLVPVNANPTREADVLFQMVDMMLVLTAMEGSGTGLNVVILDACRNNPFGGRGLRATSGGLAQMQAPEGTLISYATQPGNVAQDGDGRDSPFTKALAQTLRKPGLGIFEAFNEVGLAVMQATNSAQQPWVSSSPIRGNFQFASAQQARPATPAPAPAPSVEAGNASANRSSAPSTAPAPQGSGTNAFEPQYDRAGITIKELNLPSPDARQCQTLCKDEARCTAWVYRAPEGRTDKQPHCWLRNNTIRLPGDNLTISGDLLR